MQAAAQRRGDMAGLEAAASYFGKHRSEEQCIHFA
jgi:hypothetical protein